jgi:hypothetical protein
MFLTASDMSSGILATTPSLLRHISGGLQYFTVFIQVGLHCNVIFNQIHYSDCHKCFPQHLTCLQASCDPPSILGLILGGLEHFTVFIQFGLHCNVIFNQIHCSDCCQCFYHLTCLQALWGQVWAPMGLYFTYWHILYYLCNSNYIEM